MPMPERVAGQRCGSLLPPALAAAAVAVQLLVPGGWGRWSWAVLAAGVAAGLPHGALDHLVPGWYSRRRPAGVLAVATAYAGLAALTYVALRAAPRAGLLVFLMLSAAHFAAADASWWRRTGTGARLPAVPAVAAGAVPVVLPVVCHPAAALPLLDRIAPGTGRLLGPDVRLAAGLAVLALIMAALLLAAQVMTTQVRAAPVTAAPAYRAQRPAGEVVVLAVLFAVAPPAVAFGVYFGGWHSLRHTLRLLDTDPATRADARGGQLGRAVCTFARQAAPPAAVAAAGLAALAVAVGVRPALFLILAALTVPHLVIVGLLDRRARGPARVLSEVTGTAA